MQTLESRLAGEGWALLDDALDEAAIAALRQGRPPAWAAALRDRLEPLARQWQAHLGEAGGAASAPRPRLEDQTQAPGQGRPQSSRPAPDVFPLQLLILLSAPGRDFEGGHAIAVEQRPRMQSRPMVLPLEQGSVAVCATGPRPVQGRQGLYTTLLRLGTGRLRRGERQAWVLRWQA